jgi:hypothetical protein
LWYGLLVFALVGSATMATFHTLHFSKYLWLLLGLATNARLILNDVLEQQADREDGPSASSERDASGEES